jgi:pyrimidine-nucleoside phosphorylase
MTIPFDEWIARAAARDIEDRDLAVLAEALAASGERIPADQSAADLASTGGPGSLSTLWTPPSLVAAGFVVPKLGVRGRPAGGVDVLGSLPGYDIEPGPRKAREVLDRCGYVHVLAGRDFAPADAAFFHHRQQVGAQALPALAIASLLAKKLAMGVLTVGLEVRVSAHGNFGSDYEEAGANAERFRDVARLLGIEATCFLTDGRHPQQPYIGRGEAILALSRLVAGTAGDWLAAHAEDCRRWAIALGGTDPSFENVAKAFAANLEAQGSSVDELQSRADAVEAAHSPVVVAPHDGHAEYDLGRLREAVLRARRPEAGSLIPDDAGIILLVRPGDHVEAGRPLVSIRCPERASADLREAVADAVVLARTPDPATPVGHESGKEVVRVRSR